MGVVFKAFDPLVERVIAIKTIPLDVEGPELLVHRLQLEAKSVGQLEHPNIVTLYDAGEANGVFYMAMQFIQGETLRDRISRQRWFSLKEIQEFIRQICPALDYAHQHRVIHRDIKPSNIMITPDGMIKLTDFGIAKLAGTGTTSTGMIMGTPSYMSPEQVLGKPLDGRSDIFSLGSILYELITGEQAFPGLNATTAMYRIVHEPPSPITALQPGFDPTVERIVLKALAKQPEQRYQTCAELAAALDGYAQAGAPVYQPSPSNVPSVSQADVAPTASLYAVGMRAPRRVSLIWLAGGLLVTLLVLAGVWGVIQLRRPGPRVPASATSTTSSSETPDTASVPEQSNTPVDATTSASEPPEYPPETSAQTSQVPPSPSPVRKPRAKVPRTEAPSLGRARGADGTSAVPPGPAVASQTQQTQPETFRGYMLRGDLAFQQSRYEDALAAYSTAHQMDPNSREVRRKMVVVLTLLGRADEAQRYK